MTKPSNPRRTGGPRTSKGLAASSSNAIKLGVYSQVTVMPGESVEDFDLIVETLERDFQVEDAIERMLVHQIANVIWKLMRVERMKTQIESNLLSKPIRAAELYELGFPENPGMDFLLELNSSLTSEDISYLTALSKNCSVTDRNMVQKSVIGSLRNDRPDLLQMIETFSFRSGSFLKNFQGFKIRFLGVDTPKDEEDDSSFAEDNIPDLYKAFINFVGICQYLQKNESEIAELKHLALNKRIEEFMNRPSVSRAGEDLQRSLHRLLAELRRQKEWRKSNRIVDMA